MKIRDHPGTIVEPNLLQGGRNNYLACLTLQEGKAGLAYVDISTGELAATEISEGDIENQLRAELQRLGPAEVLLSETADEKVATGFNVTRIPNWYFEPGRSVEIIRAQFSVSDLSGLGLKPYPLAVRATGVYLISTGNTEKPAKSELSFSTYSLSICLTRNTAQPERPKLRKPKLRDLYSAFDKRTRPWANVFTQLGQQTLARCGAHRSRLTRCNISIAALKDARSLICSNTNDLNAFNARPVRRARMTCRPARGSAPPELFACCKRT